MSAQREPTAQLAPGLSLLLPLTHQGHGPGLILLTSNSDEPCAIIDGVPSLLTKWAEEGYTVIEIQERALTDIGPSVLTSAVQALGSCNKCNDLGKIGLVCM
jgi:carboxymethylenebutenolidase